MNWLDIVIVVIVIISTFAGLRSGLIKMAVSLAGLIVGVMLAGHYYLLLAGKLTFISQANIAQAVAFAIILIVVLIIAAVIAAILTSIISAVMLGWLNRIGGAVFGFVLGAIFFAALLALWVKFPSSAATIKGSSLAAVLLHHFPVVLALLPEEFHSVRSFFQ